MRPARVAALLLVLLLAAACDPGGDPPQGSPTTAVAGGYEPPSDPPSDPPPPLPPVETAGQCDDGYADVPLTPENELERWLAPSLRLCAARSGEPRFEVRNAGPAVWVLEGVAQWGQDALTRAPDDVVAFRQLRRSGLGLALEPGQDAFYAATTAYVPRFSLDPGLQVQWEATHRAVVAAKARIKQVALRRLRPEWRAVLSCGESGYGVGRQLAATDGTDAEEVAQTVFGGVSAAQDCVGAMRKAEAEAATEGRRVAVTVEDLRPAAAAEAGGTLRRIGGVLKAAVIRIVLR